MSVPEGIPDPPNEDSSEGQEPVSSPEDLQSLREQLNADRGELKPRTTPPEITQAQPTDEKGQPDLNALRDQIHPE